MAAPYADLLPLAAAEGETAYSLTSLAICLIIHVYF
jgi:hypothetical protein